MLTQWFTYAVLCYVMFKDMCYDMCCYDICYGMFPWVGWPASQQGGEEPARGRRLDRAKGQQPDNLSWVKLAMLRHVTQQQHIMIHHVNMCRGMLLLCWGFNYVVLRYVWHVMLMSCYDMLYCVRLYWYDMSWYDMLVYVVIMHVMWVYDMLVYVVTWYAMLIYVIVCVVQRHNICYDMLHCCGNPIWRRTSPPNGKHD